MTAPTFREALLVWVKIGLLSFGGPAGQIALMHRELVEQRGWISNQRFLHALNYCMLLPGPEAQQLAIYIGWLLHKVRGGLVAGCLFVLPGALLIWGISVLYVTVGNLPVFQAIFYGLKPAIMAIVLGALLKIGGKVLRRPVLWVVALAAFVAIFFFSLPFPLVVLAAGLAGWIIQRIVPTALPIEAELDDATDRLGCPSLGKSLLLGGGWGLLWIAPVILAWLMLGRGHVLTQEGIFFSKAALVTFGGAYAVLPYVAQQAVETHGWLSPAQMMDGLALAETTPGPLILVLQFVGFLGGWNEPGSWSPLVMATLAAALTSWVTFLPGFLFIFVGAPWMEVYRTSPRLLAAMAGISAAVVGVLLNLGVWFAWHVVVPEPGVIDPIPLLAAVLFFVLMRWRKWSVFAVIGAGAALGLLLFGLGQIEF